MGDKGPIFATAAYSLDDAIGHSVAVEALYGAMDIGPVDSLDPAIRDVEYDLFFGSSPLSSLSPSPMPSRSASPTASTRESGRKSGVDSGVLRLNTPPRPRPTSPTLEDCPELSARLSYPPGPEQDLEPLRSNKAAKRRRKSHANRSRKRQEARTQQDGNSAPYANGHKHVANAESIATSFDTNAIPSAASGFIALPDTDERGSKVFESKELLEGGKFKLIRWNGRYVSSDLSR